MAKDLVHDAVRAALEKDGWIVTDDPLFIPYDEETDFFIDLAAEKVIIAKKGIEKIAVEVKSLVGKSTQTEFYHILGQFLFYRTALNKIEPDRTLYLTIPYDKWLMLSKQAIYDVIIQENHLRIIIVDTETATLKKWIR